MCDPFSTEPTIIRQSLLLLEFSFEGREEEKDTEWMATKCLVSSRVRIPTARVITCHLIYISPNPHLTLVPGRHPTFPSRPMRHAAG